MAQKKLLSFLMFMATALIAALTASLAIVMVLTAVTVKADRADNDNFEHNRDWAEDISTNSKKLVLEESQNKYRELLSLEGGKKEIEENEKMETARQLPPKAVILRVFVSNSMPLSLLKEYAREARDYDAVLIFKGLPVGGFKELVTLVTNMQKKDREETEVEGRRTAMQIDDEAFEKFSISSVPSFVLSIEEDCILGQSCRRSFDKISGNIGIRAALEKFANDGDLKLEAYRCLKDV